MPRIKKSPVGLDGGEAIRRAQQADEEAARVEQVTQPPAPPANGKEKCPVTRVQFRTKAPAFVQVQVDGQTLVAERKEFSTGSLGWYCQGKVTVTVDGQPVKVQANINLVVAHSKEATDA